MKCEGYPALTQVLGDHSEGDPPVPIPNTEVKLLSPDCTARASVWESRKLPGYITTPDRKVGRLCFLCVLLARPLPVPTLPASGKRVLKQATAS